MTKKNVLGFFLLLLCVSLFTACGQDQVLAVLETASSEAEDPETDDGAEDCWPLTESGPKEESEPETSRIQVYICGAVKKSGVYEFAAGDRVVLAVEAAGGFTEDADPTALNQARELVDGEQILVLTREEAAANREAGLADEGFAAGSDPAGSSSGRINLNRATREELMTLSGIGEKRAADILAYREAHGAFSSVEEIQNVSGIGEKLFEQIAEMIEV